MSMYSICIHHIHTDIYIYIYIYIFVYIYIYIYIQASYPLGLPDIFAVALMQLVSSGTHLARSSPDGRRPWKTSVVTARPAGSTAANDEGP